MLSRDMRSALKIECFVAKVGIGQHIVRAVAGLLLDVRETFFRAEESNFLPLLQAPPKPANVVCVFSCVGCWFVFFLWNGDVGAG